MVSQLFTEKAEAVKTLPKTPDNDELLELYGLYKQATIGDNKTDKPNAFNFKAKYKWEAWKDLEGTSQEEAEELYIKLVDKLIAKYTS
ncbi:long-chain fatty acid transporter ACB1 [Ascoidea rubescens DSM 1968]|uniref:Acyl-CoA-binding protein n=1 Tax=Ascoidea rubescens DSM 1968 TaxID=1344418 RepID=A0A1D2VAS0_9ASCO|nr:acyl-CoA-binding protein [Ascoidea rubescens DSM 1968]ODV58685.1 acyl-CoA-binding protein [Ascoidea rubescens DSM 1968]